jgi:hypothetical protein
MFGPEDDEELRSLIAAFGESSWAEVAVRMTSPFTSRQCRERWRNYLNPHLGNDEWTEEEDRKLLNQFARSGTRWTVIAEAFPGRSGNSIRNRYFLLQRRKQRRPKGEMAPAPPVGEPPVTFPASEGLVADGNATASLPHRRRFPGLPRPTTLLPLPPAPHEIPRAGSLPYPPAGLARLRTDQFTTPGSHNFFSLFSSTG